jgi:hypothetical protein
MKMEEIVFKIMELEQLKSQLLSDEWRQLKK